MLTSRKTDFRSSKNNFRGHDISQGLDRKSPSLSLHFLLVDFNRAGSVAVIYLCFLFVLVKDPVLPIVHCALATIGSHFL